MAILNSMLANSRLKKGLKSAEKAKSAAGEKEANDLFDAAFKSYASIIENNSAVQKALYWWGLGLFEQAQTKSGEQAQDLYRTACQKFSTALEVDPTNSHIANDWGVALMQQARQADAVSQNALYAEAHQKFQITEKIRPGIAAYNLACIHSIRSEHEDCKNQLESARDFGTLPAIEELKEDADLANVRDLDWFKSFTEDEQETPESEETSEKSETA